MTMDKENELTQALNFLANNWCHDAQLREAFEAIFRKLSSGTKNDKVNAEILRNYLNFPGSNSALSSFKSLHASLETQQGRKAAGLTRKGRGKAHDPAKVKMDDKVMQIMIRHLLGKVKRFEVEVAILEHLGEEADPATIRKFTKAIELRAKSFVKLYTNIQASFASNNPLREASAH